MPDWNRRRFLILGSTYPTYSSKYTETVCTGALEDESREMVRLHPIPRRYLDSSQRFHAFQWIEAEVAPHPTDPRPESLRINPQTIALGESIPPSNVALRTSLLLGSPHHFRSLEALKAANEMNGTSLGVVLPGEVGLPRLEKRSAREREEWFKKQKEVLSQEVLLIEKPKPLDFPTTKFVIPFRCDDQSCPGHEMSLMDWSVHELRRKYPHDDDKVIKAIKLRLDQTKSNCFFFFGSFRAHQYNFGLMGVYSAKIQPQGELFGA